MNTMGVIWEVGQPSLKVMRDVVSAVIVGKLRAALPGSALWLVGHSVAPPPIYRDGTVSLYSRFIRCNLVQGLHRESRMDIIWLRNAGLLNVFRKLSYSS